ncbi:MULTISPECIES: hypothetical protein [Lysobacter]|uniref:hypothetical protein n=1 Tax=Lysobacter TaxID=68 RepID=UPI001F33E83A|nr:MULTISPECIES: hypothetical protein [Lysobacter]UJB21712.1 hypothetical protein L1A79_11940 [Lysobacter capsici]UJQ29171.1 hypothetical protein L2D09_02925 [Lysobacter gummosus]
MLEEAAERTAPRFPSAKPPAVASKTSLKIREACFRSRESAWPREQGGVRPSAFSVQWFVFADWRRRHVGIDAGAQPRQPQKDFFMIAKHFLPMAMLSMLALAPLSAACAHDDPIVNRAQTERSVNYEGLYTQLLERPAPSPSAPLAETHMVIANNALDCYNVVQQRLWQGWDYPNELETQDLCAPSRGAISETTNVSVIGSPAPGSAAVPSQIWISQIVRKSEPGQTLPATKALVVSNSESGVGYFIGSNQMSSNWRYDAQPEDYVTSGGMTGIVLRSTRTTGTLMVDHRQIGQ